MNAFITVGIYRLTLHLTEGKCVTYVADKSLFFFYEFTLPTLKQTAGDLLLLSN